MLNKIYHGDCLEVMRGMEENSVDAVVCDPPYGLFFMGRSWDKGTPPIPFWQEALRVAKPGAYLLAFGGTRTFHRLACAIEDAGWVLKDTLSWNYGSGFPKSHDISKAIDRKAGAEREVIGKNPTYRKDQEGAPAFSLQRNPDLTAPATPEAKQWEGWGTALKPSWEPIILAQAPLEGTCAENVLKWGCGALNIDGCRISGVAGRPASPNKNYDGRMYGKGMGEHDAVKPPHSQGRWPANFLLSHSVFCEKVGEKRVRGTNPSSDRNSDKSIFGIGETDRPQRGHNDPDGLETVEDWRCVLDCPVRMLDEQSGELKSGRLGPGHSDRGKDASILGSFSGRKIDREFGNDKGGASRFFYCAKASRSERNAGLEGFEATASQATTLNPTRPICNECGCGTVAVGSGKTLTCRHTDIRFEPARPSLSANKHPTVKPIAILRYLCRLVTPPSGLILDPFAGSGSTGCAAALEGFAFGGIEKEAESVEIARARIKYWGKLRHAK